jgi:eukaryotic-like serine/threonine-protein kinase
MTLTPGTRLGPYEIQAAIGAGGMGEVYRARDTRLDRSVAIKVLPADVNADPETRARFAREAKAIAGLSHPHICALHDVGEHEGVTFLVMEHLTGETLAQRLARGPLPLEQALAVATDVAEALGAAHRRGVVHRDLKPGNVMLTEAGAKLLDFGLAKLRAQEEPALASAVSATTLSAPLTAAGAIVGTLPYMAPEQLEGKAADARADLWALGAILYEMLTGKRAFEGESAATLIGNILHTEPAPLTTRQPITPPALERLVGRCLAKDPARRWDTAHDVAEELRWIARPTGSSPAARPSRPAGRRWALAAVLTAVALAAGAAALWRPGAWRRLSGSTGSGAITSIAVLPLENLSGDPDQEYFSDGVAEELLNDLAKIPGLRVTARTSSFQFKGKGSDLRTIGQKLNVATVLEGSVRNDGRRVRIWVRLVDARDGFHLWSETYERQVDDIFAVQEDIARSVANALKVAVLARPASGRASPTKDPEAYGAYLQGRYFYWRRGKEDLERAAAYYVKATERDPAYAAAWAGLAEVHHRQADNGYLAVDDGYERARREVQRALALDEGLALAHTEMGWIQRAHDWDWEGADASYKRALALDPGSRPAVSGAGVLAFALGRLDEAVELDKRAVALDPLSVGTHTNLGFHAYYAGRMDEATAALKKALEINPDFPVAHVVLGRVLLAQGRNEAALAEMEREADPVWRLFGLCLAYHAAGRAKEADAALASFTKEYGETMAFQVAEAFAYRSEVDRAFEWLDRAFALRDAGMADIKNDPLMKSLEGDPRYAALLRRLRLPV